MPNPGDFSRERLLEIARTLPPGPRVLARLSDMLQDINTDLPDIAEVVKIDPSLSARIVRMSNSIIYGGRSIGSIEEAVNRVGFRELHRMVGMITTDRLASRDLRYYALGAERVREHMLFTAIAAEALADICGLDTANAYTAGLLRPIGILVLDKAAEMLSGCTPYEHGALGSYNSWEAIWFGLPNSEVASVILQDWRFPKEIVQALREHALTKSGDFNNKFACLLNVAGSVALDAGHSLPGDQKHWTVTPMKLSTLGIDEEQRQDVTERALHRFTRIRGAMK
jgi:HD-like signal output (HDOD) protein